MTRIKKNDHSLERARSVVTEEAQAVASLLKTHQIKIVFAESCTGGMVAALLAGIPGISEYLCGSWVTYRDDSKVQWLGIPQELISKKGVVSEPVAVEMALRALEATPEAQLSASITGHLGPQAPTGLDGMVYTAIAVGDAEMEEARVFVAQHKLIAPQHPRQEEARLWRQLAASHSVFMMVRSLLTEGAQTIRVEGEQRNGNHKRPSGSRKRTKKQSH